METRKNKIVYILGAGASKDFGLPLGNEYYSAFDELEKHKHENKAKKTLKGAMVFLENHLKKVFPYIEPKDKMTWPNLETILSASFFLDEMDIFNHAVKLAYCILTSSMEKPFLGTIGEKKQGVDNYLERKEKLRSFIERVVSNKNDDVSFVVFNYDILLDDILEELSDRLFGEPFDPIIDGFSYCFPIYSLADKNKVVNQKGAKLIKPHGSLNLAYCARCRKVYYGPLFPYSIEHERERVTCGCGNKMKLLYVPASFNKEKVLGNDFVAEYWHKMNEYYVNVVSEADKIIIVGYTFPDYDFEVKINLLNGLKNNKNKNNVTWSIIDKGLSIKEALKNIVPDNAAFYDKGFFNYIEEQLTC